MLIRFGVMILAFLMLSTATRASIVAGHDYVVLSVPQQPDGTGKLEVIEFFSWGCPHCFDFYPELSRWMATLPKDVTVKRIPVGFGHPEWDNLARMYFALQATGDLARLDAPIFEAIHKEHVSLFDERSITAWVAKHAVNVSEFTAAFHSFGVDTNLDQAQRAVMAYRVEAIPSLTVGGRYLVSGEHAVMLSTTNELITKVRIEDKKAKKR